MPEGQQDHGRVTMAMPVALGGLDHCLDHPEIFDRLYTDWSTLVKFQRTRGVLRLMAAVIYSLWEKGDRNPLILPANISIDDPRVQFELTLYLSDNWVPVIEKDVDGPSSLPLRLDGEVPNLGKFAACRRVARAIYLGSAPLTQAAHRGLEDRRVKLGCVMPGESPAVFGDALRRLAGAATYLYQDGPRYWYSTQPTVTKLAEDRADQLKRDPDKVVHELEVRLRKDLERRGDFGRIHPMPQTGQDVPDDLDARLVVLGVDHAYTKEPNCAAETAAKAIFESRGNTPRLYRNTFVFLAADKTRLQDLDEATRRYLAWESILAEKVTLNLDPQQVKQAETQKAAADSAVTARVPETYQWLLVPVQATPQATVEWQAFRLSGQDALAIRASKKLRSDELLLTGFAATRLKMELDRVPLWRGDHVAINQLVEDFARYLYLPRLKEPAVLLQSICDGLGLLTWGKDSFAFAESYDEPSGRYRGLRCGQTSRPACPTLRTKRGAASGRRETETTMARRRTKTATPNRTTNSSPRSSENPMNSPREGPAFRVGQSPPELYLLTTRNSPRVTRAEGPRIQIRIYLDAQRHRTIRGCIGENAMSLLGPSQPPRPTVTVIPKIRAGFAKPRRMNADMMVTPSCKLPVPQHFKHKMGQSRARAPRLQPFWVAATRDGRSPHGEGSTPALAEVKPLKIFLAFNYGQ
jgi:hypothetical protein